jgi:hypothetical protein
LTLVMWTIKHSLLLIERTQEDTMVISGDERGNPKDAKSTSLEKRHPVEK